MIAYYNLVDDLYTHLIGDEDINTVAIDSFEGIDLDKRSIFGLASIKTNTASFVNGMVSFDITIQVLDLVDEDKTGIRDIPHEERWKGGDNQQDVLNTMLSVIERLDKAIRNDNLKTEGYELQGNISADPIGGAYENKLTGWTTTFTLSIPNTVQSCD